MPTQAMPRTRNGSPRLARTDDVLHYWAERIDEISPARESFRYSSMICESDSLYHYGHHFELARIMRDKRGRARLVLLNGDNYAGSGGFGPSTASRQADVRRVAGYSNVPSLVVPFSALDGAGIDYESVRPIHVRADRHTHEEHTSRVAPTTKRAQMPDPSGATRMSKTWQYNADVGRSELVDLEVPVYVDNPNETPFFATGHGWCENGATRDQDGVWRWTLRRHWLGDSLFRARCTETRTRKATAEERTAVERYEAWENEMHRLQGLQRQLPRSLPRSRFERGDGLPKGRPYDYARMLRFTLVRERLYEAVAAHYESRPDKPNVHDGRVLYRATRWATFLSSFDYQERSPLYFLCELPYGAKPGTVDDAIEALKPPEVVAALARGLNVIRQGDLFAIPTKLTKRQLRRMMGKDGFTKRLRVLGTNHSLTEGVVCTGGAVLGRGVMRHEPEGWRPPDHASVTLGKTWHLLVRNTVPRTN